MSLQYYLSARSDLALILGEKFHVRVAGKPTFDRPTLVGGGGRSGELLLLWCSAVFQFHTVAVLFTFWTSGSIHVKNLRFRA